MSAHNTPGPLRHASVECKPAMRKKAPTGSSRTIKPSLEECTV
ncbi:hypothetical protein THTE_3037 [Thermogutta terrifontis]|uniref:Uncharacterized protein n=1 Tax=Thermogutta terrifontis TaxID=1331910 RepID=A0A286RI51_9BACT|nr:hypothetical protein THTE_3037 [Thermogutta terrifontis]